MIFYLELQKFGLKIKIKKIIKILNITNEVDIRLI